MIICSGMFCWILAIIVIILIALKIFAYITLGRATSNVSLVGKTVLITGANSGLGYQTALVLAGRGARIIIADVDDASESKEKIIKETHNNNIVTTFVDLASLDSVRKFAQDINETEERLDILINNAGSGQWLNKRTKDGMLANMQINYFGHFLLTHLVIDLMKKTGEGRIIFVSSILAFTNNLTVENLNLRPDYKILAVRSLFEYSNSKLCNIIAANGFAERLKSSGITSNSVHPGIVNTPIYVNSLRSHLITKYVIYNILLRLYGKSVYDGAQTAIHCALDNELKNTTGKYFIDCRIFPQPSKIRDKEFCRKIWNLSEELVKLDASEKLT